MKRLESQSSEENISPNKGTLMMKNWLAKASSSKKTDKPVVKKNGDSPIKTHDSNKMEKKAEKLETIENRSKIKQKQPKLRKRSRILMTMMTIMRKLKAPNLQVKRANQQRKKPICQQQQELRNQEINIMQLT